MDDASISELTTRTPNGLAFEVHGSGVPLLVVHGGPGTDHSYFRPYLNPLAEIVKLIYFDLPGHGISKAASDYSLAAMSNALNEVLQTAGVRQTYLLGSSYGSFLSLLFALAHPERVLGLILVGTSASYQFRNESLSIARQKGSAAMLAALDQLWSGRLVSDVDFRSAWRELLPLYFHRLPLEEVRQLADRSTYSLMTRKQILPTLRNYDVRARLNEIRCPALIVVGEHDWITTPRQAEELARNLEKSQLTTFHESGHYPFIEENETFMRVAKEWLSKSQPRQKGKI